MNDVLDHLKSLIKDDRGTFSEQLARGMVADWGEYRHIVGSIAALDSIYDGIKEIEQQLEKAE